jgi:hypothetical protein
MLKRKVLIGAVIGSVVGIGARSLIGPDGWALGGGVAGVVAGRDSVDLAESIIESAKAGVVAAVVFAMLFGFGEGVRIALDTGNPELIAQGIGPFFSIAIIYGIGCFIAALTFGAISYTIYDSW